LQALRRDRRDARRAAGSVAMSAAEAERSGTLVIEAEGLSKDYGAGPVVADFSIRIERGDRIGVVGPNGSGKTTLVGLLTGTLKPDSGNLRLGANLQMATLDQRRESLNPDWTVAEALTGGRGDTVMIGAKPRHVVGYMRDFLFAPEQARTPLRVLSGGERGRLMLARSLARPSNVLILDEPTNDLDLETLDVLEEMLGDYAGTVVLISHDRDFLDRAVDTVIVPEGGGKWLAYAGGYSDMLAQRGEDVQRKGVKTAGKTAADKAAASSPGRPQRAAGPQRRKLSFNEKHALETLPATIAAIETEISRLQAVLADTTLYARDRAAFDEASAAMTAKQSELAAAEERWLELELLRDEIESA
ncbi:MAG: ATP-binding cassette domain-containing protein, partial [Bradyrhizobiaceae bacterium]|nr:ATP-binding cassette domain-containing protein [Bradyrhizobiaceae bacterium]